MNSLYYEPKSNTANLFDCIDTRKYQALIKRISDANISGDAQQALALLAAKQIDVRYDKLANYYVRATPEVKDIMEDMHLVIVDFDKAMEKGYFQYFEELDTLVKEVTDGKE